jgi:N-methylhydantoinase A
MGITIDIDTGSTFTDGFFHRWEEGKKAQIWTAKAETTPHDLTICFFRLMEEGARQVGMPLREFLAETKVIRFSSTLVTNALIQRSGLKVGLLVSHGAAKSAYAESIDNPILDFVVPRELVADLPNDEESEDFAKAVRHHVGELFNRGARTLVVSLRSNGDQRRLRMREKAVKDIIAADYPRHYLGAVPVLASSDLVDYPNDFLRTCTAALNAYMHRELAIFLYRVEEELHRSGLVRPLLIANNMGGVARVAKTRAIDTYSSGPVCGLMGSVYLASRYGLSNVITLDIGGTSTDIGIIRDGGYHYGIEQEIERIPTCRPFVDVTSIGGGGGSIARPGVGGGINVGPDSAGAIPGPVCYALGGTKPTVTDANLALGRLNPQRFLAGRRRLYPDRAERALGENLAKTLKVPVFEAAALVVSKLADLIGDEVKRLAEQKKLDLSRTDLFIYGGNGGIHCCDIAERLKIDRVYTFLHNSVFSAFGAATLDVCHVYDSWLGVPLIRDGMKKITKAVREELRLHRAAAERDMRSEGFDVGTITYSVELELASTDGSTVENIRHPGGDIDNTNALARLLDDFERQTGRRAYGSIFRVIRLRAVCPVPHPTFAKLHGGGADPSSACIGDRRVYWDGETRVTPIYDRVRLKAGNVVGGPAIIEADDTTYSVPPNWSFRVDSWLSGIFERVR